MEYVMVPVPEEHREAVQRLLTMKSMMRPMEIGGAAEWIEALLPHTDEFARSILRAVARAGLEERPLELAEVGAECDVSELEVLGKLVELNALSGELGVVPVLLMPFQAPTAALEPAEDSDADAAPEDDTVPDETWILAVPRAVAEVIETHMNGHPNAADQTATVTPPAAGTPSG